MSLTQTSLFNISIIKVMKVIPFGEILEDRFELSKSYKLVQQKHGIWILTDKCRKNYDSISYINYLRGSVERPGKNEGEIMSKLKTAVDEGSSEDVERLLFS